MTQEEKDLLLKDLCARLPYGVKVQSYSYEYGVETIETLQEIDSDGYTSTIECDTLKCIAKPYLFPLSSMTEEQEKELHDKLIELELKAINGEISRIEAVEFEIDFYNKHHLDWRGLIGKSLALDATNLNIY